MRVKNVLASATPVGDRDGMDVLMFEDEPLMALPPGPPSHKLATGGAVHRMAAAVHKPAAVAAAAAPVAGQPKRRDPRSDGAPPPYGVPDGTAAQGGGGGKRKKPSEGVEALAGRSGKAPKRGAAPLLAFGALSGAPRGTPVNPFGLVAPLTPAHAAAASPVLVAAPTDVVPMLRALLENQQAAAAAAAAQQRRWQLAGDARVDLRVAPGGQPGGRPKSGAKAPPPPASAAKPARAKADAAPAAKARAPAKPAQRPHPQAAAPSPSPSPRPPTSSAPAPGSAAWHPGMVSAYGITYVAPSAACPPPPPLLAASPPRWAPMPLGPVDVQTFPEEPLAAALHWLRYLAAAAGRLPQFPAPLAQSFNAEQRLYRERLVRALAARDGRILDRPRAQGTRRSARARFAPDAFVPTIVGGPEGGRGAVYGRSGRTGRDGEGDEEAAAAAAQAALDPAAASDVRTGPGFQCAPPPQRRRPAAPSAEEARWLGGLVLEPGAAPPPKTAAPGSRSSLRAMSPGDRGLAVRAATAALTGALGSAAAAAFGLGTMGAETAPLLDPTQQRALSEGMAAHGRDFPAVAAAFVPGAAPGRLAAYYYDVWKLRAVPAAAAWYQARAAAAAAREAEEAAAERHRAEEAARRAEREKASNRRRQVKDAVAWVRAAARGPAHANIKQTIMMGRAMRVTLALRLPDLAAAAAETAPAAAAALAAA
jgi:hypothetical protein